MASTTELAATQQRTSDGIIDQRVFQGIVDLNDIDSTDFSTQMVHTYLAVATSTLADMDRAVGNKDISKLSLLAVSLQDTSDAIGVTEVRRSSSRLREVIRLWSEAERKAGGAAASMDGILAAHGRLKSDFALAKSWLTRYVETGNVPSEEE
ncbi:hypothetical protein DFH94DRAFT_691219 [Russula ochroleuca]|jgi:hypothetical protein|uniref:Uncharacterized protein n=1 Tax=Russula ochroleuca TaxID=152965 RepID=A0A9P5MY64_9AGAM|nr:hypothetical protein DFH94DRAFT_691219 [Russula ochroleuca]